MPQGRTGAGASLPRFIRFSPFELDVRAGELLKHGIKVRLHQQPLRILLLLLEHPGEVVLREEIREALWPNDTVVEFDHSINAAIQRLRDALRDSADSPRFVETVARRGYRFIGTLDVPQQAPDEAPPQPGVETAAGRDPGDLSGQTFAHFRIIGKLGSGGMGVVYRADDLKLGRQVALKFLPLPLSEASAEAVDRFRREARAASALNHPNICTIYEVNEFAGQPVIVMELLEGETLLERLARGPLPPETAVPLAIRLADALAEAHRKGVVHRDVKPANVMLTKAGLKVLDFGIAKIERGIAKGDGGGAAVTEGGAILGTRTYMSPEQVKGQDADARSDIFSFGSVLWEMLTGQHAFQGETPAEVMSAILTKDPMERLGGESPFAPPLAIILGHCLEKSPEDRFQSASDLRFALEAFSRGFGVSPPPAMVVPPRPRYGRLAAIASVAVVALALAGWIGWRFHSYPPAKFQRLTFRRGFIQGARFTPDARSVIYAASWDGQPIELFSTQLGNPESRTLGFPSTGLLAIAPNGEMAVSANCRIAGMSSVGTLATMPLAGGAPREILERVLFADWTRDGKRLAIATAPEKDRPSRLEFPLGHVLLEATGGAWFGDPRISPHEDRVAFIDHYYSGDDGSIAVVDLQGRKKSLTRIFGTVQGLAWSPDGSEIWFTAAEIGNRQLHAVTLSGATRLVAHLPAALKLHDIASDGRLLLTKEDFRSSVYFLGVGEAIPRELTWLYWATRPLLSADGKILLMTENDEATGGKDVIYMRGTDGSPAIHLGDGAGISVSPDAQWVAMTEGRGTRTNLVLLPVKAGTALRIQTGSLDMASPRVPYPVVGWFPDSRQVLFTASEPGRAARTYLQDIRGGHPRPVTPEGIGGTILTSDAASLLVFDPQSNAFLFPLRGGRLKPLPALTPEYRALSFSTDGRSLYALKHGENPPRILRVDLDAGRSEIWRKIPLTDDPAGIVSILNAQITPDGRSVAYSVLRNISELYIAEGLK